MGYSGEIDVHTWEIMVQGTYIFKNGIFKKSLLSDVLEKMASKRVLCQVCICREI
jgi:hypothetical protein